MPNKNELLKDIAVALGATVTDKDNDTNELLALIRDNIQGGAAGGSDSGSASSGGDIYTHHISIRYTDETASDGYSFLRFAITSSNNSAITNVNDLLSIAYPFAGPSDPDYDYNNIASIYYPAMKQSLDDGVTNVFIEFQAEILEYEDSFTVYFTGDKNYYYLPFTAIVGIWDDVAKM